MVAIIRIFAVFLLLWGTTMVGYANNAITSNSPLGGPIIVGVGDDIFVIGPNNPVDTYFEITADSEGILEEVQLLDREGTRVYASTPHTGYVYVATASLPSDWYTLVITSTKATYYATIVVQH